MISREDSPTYEVDRRKRLLHTDELGHVSVAVDVGTGDGFSALALMSISDHVIAMDSDWTHLAEYARPRTAGKEVSLVQADFLQLPVRSVDLYCSFGSWQHTLMHQPSVEKLERAINEASLCLKSDGILLLVERTAFFGGWQPQNPFQEHQRGYYTVVERLFDPSIFEKSLLSIQEFLQMIENYFQILIAEPVYDRGILTDAFFESVRKRKLTKEVEEYVEFLSVNREIEDPMIRVVARKNP